MIAAGSLPAGRLAFVGGEIRKLPAFVRRDLLLAWSYRLAFFTDVIDLLVQVVTLSLIGLMVNSSKLPRFDGRSVSYLEFVVIGIVITSFVHVGLARASTGVRGEQLMGTLESLLVTPTAAPTLLLGLVVYDLVYIPIRTAAFLALTVAAFGVHLQVSGVGPALALVLVFVPFVWGLGVLSAASTLTFRRTGGIGFGVGILTRAYFPLGLLPHWLESLAKVNPMAIAINGMRQSLIGGASLGAVGRDLLLLAPMSAVSLAAGIVAFRLALKRERRRGSLALY